MAQWTNYWKIVKPASTKSAYEPGETYDSGSAYSNYTWYTQIMRGAGGRLQKYQQYDSMDADVDVSRALDTIAEEMSNEDEKTSLQFEIDYQNDDNKEVEESIVMTVKAGVRHWTDIHDLNGKTFHIARTLVKYGDCFFRKTSDHKPWKYIHPSEIVGIELNANEEIVSYHIRSSASSNGMNDIVSIPVNGMIHFSLSDMMGSTAPFGESILSPVIRAWKQMGLLEDATVIYRVVRAPERRVFYIDVGNMPPHKVKAYLESVKNEMKQKRIPNANGGQENIDSIYNPMSMTEDYIFGATANGRGSRVETLPGGEQVGETGDVKYFQDKVFRGLRVPTSYLRSSTDQPSAVNNDGKVGVAYIEELRFANFVRRLQLKLEKVFDAEFKKYLKVSGININENLFKLRLPDPQNFALYRQSLLNSELISTFTSADDIKYLSKRFILKKYLGFTEDDIQTNEALLRQEWNIEETDEDSLMQDIQKFYDPAVYENRKVDVPDESDPAAESVGDEPTVDGLDLDQHLPTDDKAPNEKPSFKDTLKPDGAPSAPEPSDAPTGDTGTLDDTLKHL